MLCRPGRLHAGPQRVWGPAWCGRMSAKGRLPGLTGERSPSLPPLSPPAPPLPSCQQPDCSVLWLFTQLSTAVNSVRVGRSGLSLAGAQWCCMHVWL